METEKSQAWSIVSYWYFSIVFISRNNLTGCGKNDEHEILITLPVLVTARFRETFRKKE